MPTGTGKPKVGERIRLTIHYAEGPADEPREGKVLRREDGHMWAILVQFDGERKPRWITTAGYYMQRGELEIIQPIEPKGGDA